MAKAKRGDMLICPHCGEDGEGNVEDYVVPKQFKPLEDQCGWCDEYFWVAEIEGSNEFEVTKEKPEGATNA